MKQFETFGEYMFDLLFAPLKKGRKTVNQLCIFFKVMGREFDDLKAAIFRVRSEANVASCSEVMLPVHGQDRDMPRLEGEDAEAYRTRLSMKGIISQWSGTRRGVLYALTALGYDRSRIELFADQDAERWAEFIIFLNSSKPSGVTNLSVIDGQVRKVKEGSSTNGQHQLRIEAVDGNFATSVRVFSFSKKETVIKFELVAPEETDAAATKVLVTPTWKIEGAVAKVEACNNGFDAVPTWEDITAMVQINRVYNFTNKTKTASKWGVNIRFTITKNEGFEGEVSISGFGGAYE